MRALLTIALSGALAGALAGGCGAAQVHPLSLPPPGEALEVRAGAYHQNAVMPRLGTWGGAWEVRRSEEPESQPLSFSRPWLANAPEAARLLNERDTYLALGWTLFGVGIAALVAPIVLLPLEIRSGASADTAGTILTVTLAGTLAVSAAAFILAAGERRVPEALDAYNQWLWQRLALPRTASPTPGPSLLSPTMGPAPWSAR